MSRDSIEEQIRDYYLSSSLSEQRVHATLRKSHKEPRPWKTAMASLAAAAVVMVALSIGALQIETSFFERVGAEVLFNYQKSRQKDIHVTSQISELAEEMPRLDFSIDDLPPRITEEFALVGGRYCSLRGVLAAQLRLAKHSDDQRSAVLYVARRTGDLVRIRDTDVAIGDFRIELWNDDERVFVLAVEPPGMRPKMNSETAPEMPGPEEL